MNITRREALRNCLVISIGAALIPSCLREKTKPVLALKNIDIDGDQQRLITEISETIIPATDTPGAKDTYTHLFVLKMLDDAYPKEDQQQFVKGMKEFDSLSQKKYDRPFVDLDVLQKEELVRNNINNKTGSKDIAAFFGIMKKLTLQGYMTSKYYLTNVHVYKLVPGKYTGCIPVTLLNKKGSSI